MNMPDVWKPFNGSVSFVLLRHQTRWGLKCSTLVMGSSTLMVSTKRSGCVAINAKRLTTWSVLLQKKKKRVVKWVIFPFTVAKQKMTPHKIKHAKDGRQIAPRKKASAGEGSKEQLWSVANLDLAFDLWKGKPTRTSHQRKSSQS